jgi:hypothetical protein
VCGWASGKLREAGHLGRQFHGSGESSGHQPRQRRIPQRTLAMASAAAAVLPLETAAAMACVCRRFKPEQVSEGAEVEGVGRSGHMNVRRGGGRRGDLAAD